MRRLKMICAVGVVILMFCGVQSAKADCYYRVIARDDTAAGQAEKIRVREAVLRACPDQEKNLESALANIKKAAESVAPCRVEIREWSPGNGIPTAPTLYITIGEGEGHNCWGVLYADSPRMALAEDIPGEPERVEFVWPIWQWILSLFGL